MSNPGALTVISPAETAACCAPLTAQPLSIEQAEQVAPLLKALADPVRLRLLSLVASHEGGEACICTRPDWWTGTSAAYGSTTRSAPRRWLAWPP